MFPQSTLANKKKNEGNKMTLIHTNKKREGRKGGRAEP
jgi:hypothetical protein